MPRPKSLTPKYRRHKPTGQAVVRIDGKDHGQTPVTATLSAGKHRVVLENPQTGKTVRGSVMISASETTSIKTWDALQ